MYYILQGNLNYLKWISISSDNFIYHSLHVPIKKFSFSYLMVTNRFKAKMYELLQSNDADYWCTDHMSQKLKMHMNYLNTNLYWA